MISDRGIRKYIESGRLEIKPFEPGTPWGLETPNLGTCSYNLAIDRIYELRTAFFTDLPLESDVESFLRKHGRPYKGYFEMDKEYIGVTGERIRFFDDLVVTTRSSAARLGIQIDDAYPNRWYLASDLSLQARPMYLKIRCFTPKFIAAEGSRLCQIFPNPSFYALGEEFMKAARSMEYPGMKLLSETRYGRKARNPEDQDLVPDGIVLHQGNKIRIHNGRNLEWGKDNSKAFDEVDVTGELEIDATRKFSIIPTLEYIKLPPTYCGWLWNYRRKYRPEIKPGNPNNHGTFMIHPNAPQVNPGSEGNQIFETWHPDALKFWASKDERLWVEEDKNHELERYHPLHGLRLRSEKPIAIMSLHRLDQMPENAYAGKYKGQRGPQVSLSQLD